MTESSEIPQGGNKQFYVNDMLYLFTIFMLPFLGYVSSLIYRTEANDTWYKTKKFKLVDLLSNINSYGLLFTLFIYMFTGMGIVYLANFYLGLSTKVYNIKSQTPVANLSRFWDNIMLYLIPIGLFLLWISVPLMYKYKSTSLAGILSIFSSIIFCVVTFYFIKIHWMMLLLFAPLCIWCIYSSVFFFAQEAPSSPPYVDSVVPEEITSIQRSN